MKVVVTGSDGFIGKNLVVSLGRNEHIETIGFNRATRWEEFSHHFADCDFVVHLAGVNRPQKDDEFVEGNVKLTEKIVTALCEHENSCPVMFSSSIQAAQDNAYGASKSAAEHVLKQLHADNRNPVCLFRLPNVFGKWSRPYYNSAVATFCQQTVDGKDLTIHDPSSPLRLLYVDDFVAEVLRRIEQGKAKGVEYPDVAPVYETTVGEVASLIQGFRQSRFSLVTERVGTGLQRALHATYLSFLPPEEFSYRVKGHADDRGVFVEMLKTRDSGQFSYFTAAPGITRGRHYHDTKTEKFLVVKGQASFQFEHVYTGERYNKSVSDKKPEIVETIPGWAHDITNTGDDELIVLLWANEIFDPGHPDTYGYSISG